MRARLPGLGAIASFCCGSVVFFERISCFLALLISFRDDVLWVGWNRLRWVGYYHRRRLCAFSCHYEKALLRQPILRPFYQIIVIKNAVFFKVNECENEILNYW